MVDSLNEIVTSKMSDRNDRLALIIYWSLASVAVGLGAAIPDVQVAPNLIDYQLAVIVQTSVIIAFSVFVGLLAIAHFSGYRPTRCSQQGAKKQLSVRDIFVAMAVCAAVITAMGNYSWGVLSLLFYSIAWLMVVRCIVLGSTLERTGAIVLVICQIASGLSSLPYGLSSGNISISIEASDFLSYLFLCKPTIFPCSMVMWFADCPVQELVNVCTMFTAFELMIGVLLLQRGVKRSMAFAALVLLGSFASQFSI